MSRIKNKSEQKWRLAILVVSVLLSVLVGLISALASGAEEIIIDETGKTIIQFKELNIGISLMLGVCTFIVIELIALVYYSMSYADKKEEEAKFMENITEYSNMLHNINNFYRDVVRDSHGDNDLFVVYAKKEIEKLNATLRRAATQKEFNISTDYIINSEGVFDAFKKIDKEEDKILRMTFPVDEKLFFSSADSHFFEVLHEKVSQKVLHEVRVVLILPNESAQSNEMIKKLMDYYAAETNFKMKISYIEEFQKVCDSNGINSQWVDFGMYGDKMLFVAEQYEPEYKGTYYKDYTHIQQYLRLFDEAWKYDGITLPNPSTNTTKIAVNNIIVKLIAEDVEV